MHQLWLTSVGPVAKIVRGSLGADAERRVTDLASKQCVPCKGGVPPLKGAELQALHAQLDGGWEVVGEHHLEREYRFKNFREALAFTNQVGELAEAQNHHPDLLPRLGTRARHDLDPQDRRPHRERLRLRRQVRPAGGRGPLID